MGDIGRRARGGGEISPVRDDWYKIMGPLAEVMAVTEGRM